MYYYNRGSNAKLASAYGLPYGTLFSLEDFNDRSNALTNIILILVNSLTTGIGEAHVLGTLNPYRHGRMFNRVNF